MGNYFRFFFDYLKKTTQKSYEIWEIILDYLKKTTQNVYEIWEIILDFSLTLT